MEIFNGFQHQWIMNFITEIDFPINRPIKTVGLPALTRREYESTWYERGDWREQLCSLVLPIRTASERLRCGGELEMHCHLLSTALGCHCRARSCRLAGRLPVYTYHHRNLPKSNFYLKKVFT